MNCHKPNPANINSMAPYEFDSVCIGSKWALTEGAYFMGPIWAERYLSISGKLVGHFVSDHHELNTLKTNMGPTFKENRP